MPKRLKDTRLNLKYLFYILVLVVLVVFIIIRVNKDKEPKVATISKSSLEEVLEKSDLSTIRYIYNSYATVNDEETDEPKYYVAYEGDIDAGIDFSKIDFDIDKDNKIVTITIPDPKIQSVSVDIDSLDFIFKKNKYETESVSQEAYKKATEDLEKKSKEETEILKLARENAKDAVTGLFKPWITNEDSLYEVRVK